MQTVERIFCSRSKLNEIFQSWSWSVNRKNVEETRNSDEKQQKSLPPFAAFFQVDITEYKPNYLPLVSWSFSPSFSHLFFCNTVTDENNKRRLKTETARNEGIGSENRANISSSITLLRMFVFIETSLSLCKWIENNRRAARERFFDTDCKEGSWSVT